jgi:hypothetical protein
MSGSEKEAPQGKCILAGYVMNLRRAAGLVYNHVVAFVRLDNNGRTGDQSPRSGLLQLSFVHGSPSLVQDLPKNSQKMPKKRAQSLSGA